MRRRHDHICLRWTNCIAEVVFQQRLNPSMLETTMLRKVLARAYFSDSGNLPEGAELWAFGQCTGLVVWSALGGWAFAILARILEESGSVWSGLWPLASLATCFVLCTRGGLEWRHAMMISPAVCLCCLGLATVESNIGSLAISSFIAVTVTFSHGPLPREQPTALLTAPDQKVDSP